MQGEEVGDRKELIHWDNTHWIIHDLRRPICCGDFHAKGMADPSRLLADSPKTNNSQGFPSNLVEWGIPE
jgi:hypothetical protein